MAQFVQVVCGGGWPTITVMTNPRDRSGASAKKLCEVLDIDRPVVLAPMAKVSGGVLAASVSDAGGLGILGGGYGDAAWLDAQMSLAEGARVGVGIIAWNMADGGLDVLLAHEPCAVWLAFGDLAPHIVRVRDAGVRTICQVATAHEADEAVRAGADVIVAQGTESGGHGRPSRSVAQTVAEISDAMPEIPLVAAGGLNSQNDLDALHEFGAAGAALGTAFYATHEALEVADAKQRLVALRGEDTVRSRVYDHVRGPLWPDGYDGRTGRTQLTDEWVGREVDLASDVDAQRVRHETAVSAADMSVRVLWAGEGVGAIDAVVPASTVVERFDAVR